jgi:hypothetical protein
MIHSPRSFSSPTSAFRLRTPWKQALMTSCSHRIIQQLVADVLQGVSALYKASEAVSTVDRARDNVVQVR